jgi:hypothetical protein
MDILATKYKYKPLVWAKNPIYVQIEAWDVDNVARDGYVYYCEIWVPKSYKSAEYERICTLRGHEKPAKLQGVLTVYEGCTMQIEDYVGAYLEKAKPNDDAIQRDAMMTGPYRVVTYVKDNGVLIAGSVVNEPIKWAIKAGLSADSYSLWSEAYWTGRRWLSHTPVMRTVDTKTPSVLSYLVHADIIPVHLKLRVEVVYRIADTRMYTAKVIENVGWGDLIHIQLGYEALGLATDSNASQIVQYGVWLSDDEGYAITDKAVFKLDDVAYDAVRYVLAYNSLGGRDVWRMTGSGEHKVKTTQMVGERILGPNYSVENDEIYAYNKRGKRYIDLLTGYAEDPELLDAMQELQYADSHYIATAQGWVPMVLQSEEYISRGDAEDIGQRKFVFEYGKSNNNYDKVGYRAKNTNARPTVWVPSGSYCLVDGNGLRTGYMGAGYLELHYSDVSPYEKVKGYARKPNVPNTEGYIAPVLNTSSCVVGSAAYRNAAISRTGTKLRNNCVVGNTGVPATITIAANLYGGETQALADSLAEDAWTLADTQEAANANTSGCVLAPEGYAYSVASGYMHVRWNAMNMPGNTAHFCVKQPPGGLETKGNGWFTQNVGIFPDTYWAGTNDIDIPTTYQTGEDWKFGIYGRLSGSTDVTIYVNAVAVYTASFNSDYVLVRLAHSVIPSGAKVYVKVL